MSRTSFRDDPAFLFELRLRLCKDGLTVIRAFEAPLSRQAHRWTTGHTTIDLQLVHCGRELWARGSTTVGTPAHVSVDGESAKALALSLFALKPGDTDREFFDDYTPEQLEFAGRFGEEISMIQLDRFGEDA